MMYGIIYKATNLIDGKIYIGQTTRTLEKRRKEHEKPSKHNYLFQRAIRKYGKANDVSRKNVLDCIRGKQTNVQGFIYLYSDAYSTPRELKSEIQLRNEKKGNRYPSGVYQFNKQGQFLIHYSSTKEASLATNIPSKSIQKSCSKECLSTKGFVFLYKDIYPSIQEAQNEVLIRMKLTPIQREVA